MQIMELELENSLERMWSEHGAYLRRMLISLSRDIDLADDLLQETYVRAREAIGGYRGGDARAWLAAIAKNCFLGHVRRPYVRSEVRADDEFDPTQAEKVDWTLALAIRDAVSDLEPRSRTALIMRHYGGYSYQEIAEHLECPLGTAKWLVFDALGRLRSVLCELEAVEMECTELIGLPVLDYLYGALPDEKRAEFERHLESCLECRAEVDDVRRIVTALDAVEDKFKLTAIIELDNEGVMTSYISGRFAHEKPELLEVLEFSGDKGLKYLSINGEEHAFEIVEELEGNLAKYRASLREPILSGEPMDVVFIVVEESKKAENLGNGRWRFGPGKLHSTEPGVGIAAVRLPCGARLSSADPQPTEVRSNDVTTIIWRKMLEADEVFTMAAEYRMS